MSKLTKRSLRAMRDRWKADLDRLEASYPVGNWEGSGASIETVRNLATAIAEIDGIITDRTIFPAGRAASKPGGKHHEPPAIHYRHSPCLTQTITPS